MVVVVSMNVYQLTLFQTLFLGGLFLFLAFIVHTFTSDRKDIPVGIQSSLA